jgi:nucleolysin TIA-1/TIAR
VRKLDAQSSIEQMNGQWLGSRSIRTNWATRKPPSSGGGYGGGGGGGKTLNYDEVFRQASPTNFTVYVGGTTSGDESVLREAFKVRRIKGRFLDHCRIRTFLAVCIRIVLFINVPM